MNNVILSGKIQNIKPSHVVGDVQYDMADIVVSGDSDTENVLSLKFKRFSNEYKDGDDVSLIGNIRSFSHKVEDRNKVDIYVFTYFDKPEKDITNDVLFDGRICKIEDIRKTSEGKSNLHFTVANNLDVSGTNKKLNSYIPCVVWGNLTKKVDELGVGCKVKVHGELHSREYKKKIPDDEYEIRVAHEVFVKEITQSDAETI